MSEATGSKIIVERISKIRQIMKDEGVAVYVVCTGDYHMSEYTSEYFNEREYASGFTGSAGTLVVTRTEAALFTDGRYHVQAAAELTGTGIQLMKSGCEGVPSVNDYCLSLLKSGDVLGLDGRTVSASFGAELEKKAKNKEASVNYEFNAIEKIWQNRPEFPCSQAFHIEAGESVKDKLTRVREYMKSKSVSVHVLASLDDICWLLNVRGRDVACNPVIMSYMLITDDKAKFYVNEQQIEAVRDTLENSGIEIKSYNDIYEDCKKLEAVKVLADKKRINFALYKILSMQEDKAVILKDKQNPTVLMKAVKNETEINNLKEVHIEDGLAVTRFIYWVKNAVKSGVSVTEAEAAEYLDNLRAGIKDFVEPSFDTISAYGANAAMMHYHADKDNSAVLKPRGMLLVDSGGQYLRGTTDVTRTIALGEVSDLMKKHFTLTLKGMLALADAKFLKGCTGQNLDILARQYLWDENIDYMCGTGHGVGYMLNVHESPNNFRWKPVTDLKDICVLEPGMVTSDEPGVYIEGEYGIRIENEILCVEKHKNEYGTFLGFEMLTCVPIDLELIDVALLDKKDKERLNRYHAWVYEKLSELVQGKVKTVDYEATESDIEQEKFLAYLKNATAPIV